MYLSRRWASMEVEFVSIVAWLRRLNIGALITSFALFWGFLLYL